MEANGEERMEFRQEVQAVSAALDQLPNVCRETLILRRVEGLSQKEVARRLNISEKTVEKHMANGVRLLIKIFGRGGKPRSNTSTKQEMATTKMASTNLEIDSLAADWAARRDFGPLSAQEQAEFEAWLAADARHLGAYGRAEAVLARLDRLASVGMDAAADRTSWPAGWIRRRAMLAGGAMAAAAAGIGIALFPKNNELENLSTEIGQMRETVLADGSVVSLNTDSEMSVQFTSLSRMSPS